MAKVKVQCFTTVSHNAYTVTILPPKIYAKYDKSFDDVQAQTKE